MMHARTGGSGSRRRSSGFPALVKGAGLSAVAVLAATLVATCAPSASAATTPPATPAPSAIPATPLQSAWESVLAEPGIAHALIGGEAYDVTTGRMLAAVHPDWRLTPGSVTKLYASSASLADWGTRFDPVTQVEQATPGGPVYLVGAGDLFNAPPLKPVGNAELAALARSVAVKLGGHATQVVGVDPWSGGWTSGPGWDVSEVGVAGDPSVSALTSDHDALHVLVTAAAQAGGAPAVAIDPQDPTLVPPGSVQVDDVATTGAAGSPNTLFVRCLPDSDTILITGSVPVGAKARDARLAIGDPARFTAAVFQSDLAQDGVTLTAPATTGALAPGARILSSHDSPWTLTSWLTRQNSESINEMAENLYRLLGVATGSTGTPTAAHAALDAYLTRAGLSLDRVQVDGSGLSGLDEMSAGQVVGLLAYVAHQPYFQTLEHSLIHIGRTSQCTFLCGYMDHTAADGTVWLKTGNLANQWNYAGYAHAENGDLIAFTLLFDGLQGSNPFGQAIGPIDRMTVDTARWPHEPATAAAPAVTGEGSLPAGVASLLPAGVVSAADGGGAAGTAASDGGLDGGAASGDIVSASVADAATGQVLAQSNGETELQGGLLPRLATVAAFLHDAPAQSGPAVRATGPVTDGQLQGSLILDGHHDPQFSDAQLTGLAQSLAHRGITSVSGPLQYVGARPGPFGDQPDGVVNMPFSTPHEDVGAVFAPPASPLVVDEDQVTLTVQGAASAGQPAQVSVSPAGAPVSLTGDVTTGASETTPTALWQPALQDYALSGEVAPGQSVSVVVAPPDPGLVAADEFIAALHAAGISIANAPVELTGAPSGEVLATEPAAVPATEAQVALTDPSDVTPFQMYEQLAPQAGSKLAALVGPEDQIIDPSGNAAYDYLTADSISQMLATVHSDPSEAPLVTTLSQPWIVQQPERTTIAGYTTGPGGETLAYTVIVNGELFDPGADLPSEYEPAISH